MNEKTIGTREIYREFDGPTEAVDWIKQQLIRHSPAGAMEAFFNPPDDLITDVYTVSVVYSGKMDSIAISDFRDRLENVCAQLNDVADELELLQQDSESFLLPKEIRDAMEKATEEVGHWAEELDSDYFWTSED